MTTSNDKQNVQFSIVSSHRPQSLTKKYYLNNGAVQKKTSAQLYQGTCQYSVVRGPEEFAEVLSRLEANQALCYGLPPVDNCKLTTKELRSPQNKIYARTNEDFHWPNSAGVLMLDYDPLGNRVKTEEELYKILTDLFPDLTRAGSVWWPSSSSFIFNSGNQVNGLKGQRIYYFIDDASDIERAGKVIINRLWLNGLGDIVVSKSGQMLERTVFDASVWQPCRLDFAAGADCTHPIEQRRGQPKIRSGVVINSHEVFKDLSGTEIKHLEAVKRAAKREKNIAANLAKEEFIEQKANEIAESNDERELKEARETVSRALSFCVFR